MCGKRYTFFALNFARKLSRVLRENEGKCMCITALMDRYQLSLVECREKVVLLANYLVSSELSSVKVKDNLQAVQAVVVEQCRRRRRHAN